jgi:hypothetical protein
LDSQRFGAASYVNMEAAPMEADFTNYFEAVKTFKSHPSFHQDRQALTTQTHPQFSPKAQNAITNETSRPASPHSICSLFNLTV